MAKFYGPIGYAELVETKPGVWQEEITERNYYCEITRNSRRFESSGNLNDNLNISNEFSIVADPFARDNFHKMRYIEFRGSRWKITNVEDRYPRLILSVGGVYNGQ
jgi:hypothetical protein